MSLTRQRLSRDPEKFPTVQLFLLGGLPYIPATRHYPIGGP
jgi:hypothetical protein